MARTLPLVDPATNASPTRSVPFCTSTLAMIPRPCSTRDSMTTPRACFDASALSSRSSDWSRIISSSLSTLVPFLAEIGTAIVLPPHSSTSRLCFDRSCRTISTLASGRSILLIAMIIGTLAARAWSMASTVCGMTRSSAATTRTTISVTCAPRARMAVNASWPGVSRNVMRSCEGSSTSYAPMCCVMPPASPAMTLVFRM